MNIKKILMENPLVSAMMTKAQLKIEATKP